MKKSLIRFALYICGFFALIFALSLFLDNGESTFINTAAAQEHKPHPIIKFNKKHPIIQVVREVKKRHISMLMRYRGVVGTAVGLGADGKPVIKVFTVKPSIPDIPTELEGIPVQVEVTGMVVALTDPKVRHRPAPIGVSTGHPNITAGTIGARVTDGSNYFALSNNHVFANSNDANIGDSILQPGPADGGSAPDDVIATLDSYVPIDFSGGDNIMDAAIALVPVEHLLNRTATPENGGYGVPTSDIEPASLEQVVQKYGRTTGLTSGEVTGIDATVNVCYLVWWNWCLESAIFVDQIQITSASGSFSAGGDSGSLVVDMDRNPVGLLFAGSSEATFANPIGPILNHFDVTIDGGEPAPTEPYTDIAIAQITANSASVIQGETVNVEIIVTNTGNQDVTDTINVKLEVKLEGGGSDIYTQPINNGLTVGSSETLVYVWNTDQETLPGSYTLTATHDFSDINNTNDVNDTEVNVIEALTDIEITEVMATPTTVQQGDNVSVTVTVTNTGNQDVTNAINVELNDGGSVIDTQTINNGLTVGSSETLVYVWNTDQDTSPGPHTLTATHDFLDIENDTNDVNDTEVNVIEPTATTITLSATASPDWWGRWKVSLNWSGATSSSVDIKRNGSVITTTNNDGSYTNRWLRAGTYTYQVCEEGSDICSDSVMLSF